MPHRGIVDGDRADKSIAFWIKAHRPAKAPVAGVHGPFAQEVSLPAEVALEARAQALVDSRAEYAAYHAATQKIDDLESPAYQHDYVGL